jgi:hypothetical protein
VARLFTTRNVLTAFVVLVVGFVLIQLVPYRVKNHPVVQEPTWDSPRTRELAKLACFDCHSNQSHPYSFERIAPLSWWITNHVDEGRASLNFSSCTRRAGAGAGDAAETVREGSMPPAYYYWFGLHHAARLTASEKAQLAAGLDRTLAGWSCGSGAGG